MRDKLALKTMLTCHPLPDWRKSEIEYCASLAKPGVFHSGGRGRRGTGHTQHVETRLTVFPLAVIDAGDPMASTSGQTDET